MRYERPTIIRREPIAALLATVKSEYPPPQPGAISDVNLKANVRPVTWGARRERYAAPAIDGRVSIEALLINAVSDEDQSDVPSDVNLKADVRPVAWGPAPTVDYVKPAISGREALQGLLSKNPSDLPKDVAVSDVRIKDNIVPVRW